MSSSKEEFHQVMETNVDDAEIPPPNASRNQIAMMYLASERRNKELEDQLEKANETNEKMQRRAAAFKSKKQVVQNAIGDILQSFNALVRQGQAVPIVGLLSSVQRLIKRRDA